MAGVWAEVVPLALGAAVSPLLLTTQLLILSGGNQPIRRGWAFAVGVALTSIVYVVVLATVASGLSISSDHQPTVERVIKMLAALALVGLGIRAQLHHPDPAKQAARARRLSRARLIDFAGLGFVIMCTNLSSLVLMLPAVHLAVHTNASGAQEFALLGFIVLCAAAPALLPALAVSLFGRRSESLLARVNRFTTKHSAAINAAICYLFAVLLLISALTS